MRTVSSVEYARLVGFVEQTLRQLSFRYYTNATRRVTEYEVFDPARFRILVEDALVEPAALGPIGAGRKVTAIEVRRDIGASEPVEDARRHAREFVTKLISLMPMEPWKGLGLVRSRTVKARWLELGKL
ncbi:MAG: hypothetical protein LYZ69_00480 [Nitrososphaerales archaeon]|nr:hypothetical protein [Nitrososphaerales archaeon]